MTRQAEDRSLEPEAVAAAVIEALTSETPKTRWGGAGGWGSVDA